MATAENLPGEDPREEAAKEFAKKQRPEQEAMRKAADKPGVAYEKTEGGYAVSGGAVKQERPNLKVIKGGKEVLSKKEEEKPTLFIGSENERQEMFDELTKSFSEGKVDFDQFTEQYNDIYQAEIEETLVEPTKVSPKEYIELQDLIKEQYKDPREQASKLALLDEMTELDKDKEYEEEISLENLIKASEEAEQARIEKENQAAAGVLKGAAELLEDGTLKFTEAQEITTETFADKKAKEVVEGKIEIDEAMAFRKILEENTDQLSQAIEERKAELTKEAVEQMKAGIDKAHEAGDLSFSSEEFNESWEALRAQAKKIQDELGINVQKPGLIDRLKMQALRLQPSKWKAYMAPWEKFQEEYRMKENQVAESAPQVLASKPLGELQRAGMVSSAKIPEKALTPEEKLKRDLDSGKITLNEYLKITTAADKLKEELETKHQKKLEDIEIIKSVPVVMKNIDRMRKEGKLDMSSTEYQKAVHDLYANRNWLEENANYNPADNFFTSWTKAREAQVDMNEYRKHRKQYLQAENDFRELNSKLEKANFWNELSELEEVTFVTAKAATEPNGPEAPTPSTINRPTAEKPKPEERIGA